MKTLTKCIKLLAFTGLLMSAKTNVAQTCATSFSTVTGSNGNVNFYATAVGNSSINPGTFYWNFGNGSTTSGSNLTQPSTTYTANGTYIVTLAYLNSSPTCSSIVTRTVVISNVTTPTCNLVANFSQSVTANGVVYFVNTSTGTSNTTT